MATLGVALITRNAARHLADCLQAVAFADDIVLLDQLSTDGTREIAAACGARVVDAHDWPGFGAQKNRAIDLLETDWILLLDADEVVSPQLAQSIRAVCRDVRDVQNLCGDAPADAAGSAAGDESNNRVADAAAKRHTGVPEAKVYALDRVSSFCGQWVHHSGWRPDIVPRLFRRGTARLSDDRVHERLLSELPVHTLAGDLAHYSYDDIDTVIRKIDQYAREGARQRFERRPGGKAPSVAKAYWRGVWAFLRTYVLKRGFLDGHAGLMIALMNAQTVYYRFLRLREHHLSAGHRAGD